MFDIRHHNYRMSITFLSITSVGWVGRRGKSKSWMGHSKTDPTFRTLAYKSSSDLRYASLISTGLCGYPLAARESGKVTISIFKSILRKARRIAHDLRFASPQDTAILNMSLSVEHKC